MCGGRAERRSACYAVELVARAFRSISLPPGVRTIHRSLGLNGPAGASRYNFAMNVARSRCGCASRADRRPDMDHVGNGDHGSDDPNSASIRLPSRVVSKHAAPRGARASGRPSSRRIRPQTLGRLRELHRLVFGVGYATHRTPVLFCPEQSHQAKRAATSPGSSTRA
jgi:hypothetical protein